MILSSPNHAIIDEKNMLTPKLCEGILFDGPKFFILDLI